MDAIRQFFEPWLPFMRDMSGLTLWVLYAVIVATTLFLLIYVPRALFINAQLRWKVRHIRRLQLQAQGGAVDPAHVSALMRQEPYRHLWDEYDDTLHRLKRYSGENAPIAEVRATVPAESFFTRETLVDSRLLDEFVRHLPGILTGLGIIGTFAGLLAGLHGFTPSEDASTARQSLQVLLTGVGHAFYASAIAIGCAMAITFLEKVLIAFCYTGVERLAHVVDSLYNTGAGEEYLSRLVDASETSAAQTSQLKDALVEDLKTMMTNLVERQIAAQREETHRLGERIGQSISDGLVQPMQQLMGVVERAAGQQGTQVQGLLENLLSAFMAKLEDTFGKQLHGINDALLQSQQSMQTVQSALVQLVNDIGNAGEAAASQMSAKLEEAMSRAASAQERMNDQMRDFINQIRALIAEQQSSSKAAMEDAVRSVLTAMNEAMTGLAQARRAGEAAEQTRHEALRVQTNELYAGLSGEMSQLLERIGTSATKTQESIDSLERVTTRAIDGMNTGAETLNAAANRFADAGKSVSGVVERSEQLHQQLLRTSDALNQSSQAARTAFEQYDRTRGTIERMVGELSALVENAKREAGVNKSLVEEMERALAAVKAVQVETTGYLNQVNDVLRSAFQEFGSQLANQVGTVISQTDRHTSTAVTSLTGIVQELGAALSRLRKAA